MSVTTKLQTKPKTETIADRIRVAREDAGISQSDLAALIGVHARTIQRWEFGQQQPHSGQVVSIAEITKVRPCWLLMGAE